MSPAEAVLSMLAGLPDGSVLRPGSLSRLASRSAVNRALCRLVRSGRLIRAARGLYVRAVNGRFGIRAPSPSKVAERLAELTGEAVLPSGAAEANRLGLTAQVPVRHVFVTSGPALTMTLGAGTLEVRHAPRWQTVMPGTEAGAAVRALAWLGRREASRAAAKLHATLPEAEWKALTEVRPGLPSWMAAAIGTEMRRQANR